MPVSALSAPDHVSPRSLSPDGTLAGLRQRIAALERGGSDPAESALALGFPEVDAALPGGGLDGSAVHEVGGGAAAGFAALVAARREGPVLWCLGFSRREEPYGPGLAALGLDPARLVLIRCRNLKELLWTMEEGLRSAALAAVIAQPEADIGLVESRRLQLAAETGGTLGLILRDASEPDGRLAPSAVSSRWRVEPAPGGGWRTELLRCRGARLARTEWKVEWHDTTGHLALAAAPGDGPVAAQAGFHAA